MNIEITLRPGAATDLEPILALVMDQFDEHDINLPTARLRAAVAAILENQALGLFIVAEQEGLVVGMAALAFVWTLEHAGQTAWLDELYVLPEWRGRGIGTALVRESVRLAADRGCIALDLEVDHDHSQAEALYAREGFSPLPRSRWVHMLPHA